MNSGTRRRDVVFTRLGALVIAGLETWAGGVRTAMLVGAADGPDRAGSVTVEDEGLCVAELVEAVGVRNVGTVAPAQHGYSRPGQFDGDQRGAARVGESLR